MSNLPPNSPGDPLDERMRTTLRAEQLAAEVRLQNRLAAGTPVAPRPRPKTMWLLPAGLAVAALAIFGFVFLGGNGNDAPEQVDVAGQSDDSPADDGGETDDGPADDGADPQEEPPIADEPVGVDDAPTPVPTPDVGPPPASPAPPADPTPVPAPTECPGVLLPASEEGQTYFVVGIQPDDPDGGLVAHTEPGVDAPPIGVFPPDAVVTTIECELVGDTPWVNVASPSLTGWVNGNWLAAANRACLFGEQLGSVYPDGERVDQILGPVEGFAFGLSGPPWVAFAPLNASQYRWYDEGVGIGVPCYLPGPQGEVCLTGDIVLVDLMAAEPVFAGSGPLRGDRTGRLWAPLEQRGLATESVEVNLADRDGNVYTGFVDPVTAGLADGVCEDTTDPLPGVGLPDTADDFTSLPCTLAPNTAPGSTADYPGTASAEADHIHNLRIDSDGSCVRVVIELGGSANDSNGPSGPVGFLPAVSVVSTGTETTVRFPDGLGVDFDAPSEAIFGGHVALVTIDEAGPAGVTIGHPFSAGWATLLESPARIVIDLQTRPTETGVISGPIVGPTFVLSNPIQADLNGPGLTAGEPIRLTGFGRPFEAQGTWRVYAWPSGDRPGPRPDDLTALFVTEPLASGLAMTTSWVDGWGSFDVTFDAPSVEGTYIVVVGDESPADGAFEAVGQLIRVNDPATPSLGPIEPWLLPQRD